MKGIILAGDSGNGLYPLTRGIPKQLLPIYDKPMVYYAIDTLAKSGIRDILVITSTDNQASFQRALGNGKEFGVNFSYAIQERPEGVAQAIVIGKDFIANDSICLITGDTIIIGDSLNKMLMNAYKAAEKSGNATIFVDRENDPKQYGVVVLGEKGMMSNITGISYETNYYSITGLYVFPNSVLKHISSIEKSERRRYEITSVNEIFHNEKKLQIQRLPSDCQWLDTNSFKSLVNSCLFIQKKREYES